MRIGILGSGNMGRSLGILWSQAGHDVFFGSRDHAAARRAAELSGTKAQAGNVEEAARFGDVLLYSARHVPPAELVRDLAVFDGKVVIDPNNGEIPAGFAFVPIECSHAETLQAALPRSRVVKAFNTMAQEVFELSGMGLKAHRVSAFVAADDKAARDTVMRLAADIEFEPTDCGPLRNARLLEGLGDFIRSLIGQQRMGPMATLSVHTLPAPFAQRLGGRDASRLSAPRLLLPAAADAA
jgi:8-hydroxy-5-deazaflavin:NADPH oxidoreductase